MHDIDETAIAEVARFWGKVRIPRVDATVNQCWEWVGSKKLKGYGIFRRTAGKTCAAHRYSWELHFGEISDPLLVCHHCDNPSCVRPSHLFLGTDQDNVDDRVRKGRSARLSGEQHPRSKVSTEQAAAFRIAYFDRGISQKALAAQYGLSAATVYRAIHDVHGRSR